MRYILYNDVDLEADLEDLAVRLEGSSDLETDLDSGGNVLEVEVYSGGEKHFAREIYREGFRRPKDFDHPMFLYRPKNRKAK